VTSSDGAIEPLRRVAVVGASLAGVRTAEALRRHGFDGSLVIVGAESHFPPFDRPPLSKEVLAGRWEHERGRLRVAPDLDAELVLGRRAVGLDLGKRRLALDDGEEIGFDGLVVATGCSPRRVGGESASLPGVHVLRTVDECLALRAELDRSPRVVVVGAGFIGSEVAATCRGRGLDVTVVEALPLPLVAVLGPQMGEVMARLHRDHGTKLRLGVGVAEFAGRDRVEEVVLSDGSRVAADVVVIGVGVAPETGWLAGSGLSLDNGVVCDDRCAAVGADRVVVAGDVARWFNPLFGRHMRVEHWTNAVEQGDAAARRLVAGVDGSPPFAPAPYFWSDQYDAKVQFVGMASQEMSVVEGDVGERKFVAAFGEDGRTVGALCFSWPARLARYRRLVAAGAPFPPPPPEAPLAPGGPGGAA
jgi:NADPH-dependent 2,4-dienoyl-CoA reductase/sulfur reductase-like enzyme